MYLGSSELDPKKLIYFVTVIERGSLKKAAKVLDVSQPALSASMSRLEADVGQKLLERGHSGVVPTRFGDLIYAHARLIRDELKLLERHLLDRRHQEDPAIRFGALPSLSVTVIPKAVSRWRVKYPNESLQISQKVQIELLHALLGRELDVMVGVTDSYDLLSGLKQRVLFRESLHVIARADHALFLKPDLRWADLVVFPLGVATCWTIQYVAGRCLEGRGPFASHLQHRVVFDFHVEIACGKQRLPGPATATCGPCRNPGGFARLPVDFVAAPQAQHRTVRA